MVKSKKVVVTMNAEIFMETFFIQNSVTTEGTWLHFKDTMKQEQTLLYQGGTFELDSKQYIFDQNTKPIFLTIVNYSNSTTAKIVNAGHNWWLTSKFYEMKNLVVQVKNKTKLVDDIQLFETNNRNQ